jgi:hypothetical protein
MPATPWYNRVNASPLSDEARRLIFERVKRKLGFTKTLEVLGIARGLLHNYLYGLRTVPVNVVYKALQHLEEGEFNEIVQGVDRLRAIGIIRMDNSIDYSLVLQAPRVSNWISSREACLQLHGLHCVRATLTAQERERQ